MGEQVNIKISLEQDIENFELQIKSDDVAIRTQYRRKVTSDLKKRLKQKYDHDELIEAFFLGDDDGISKIEETIKDKYVLGVVKNAQKEYNGLLEVSFLFLVAPSSTSTSSIYTGAGSSGDKLTYQQDCDARYHQLQNLYDLYTNGRDVNKYKCMYSEVKTFDDIVTSLGEFKEKFASNSKRVYIFFNGHGREAGETSYMCLEDLPEGVKTSVYISTTKKLLLGEKGDLDKVKHPGNATLVLVHCYSHLHEQKMDETSRMDVISLTNRDEPTTEYCYSLKGGVVACSINPKLNNYMREVVKKENVSKVPETSKKCPNDQPSVSNYGDSAIRIIDIIPLSWFYDSRRSDSCVSGALGGVANLTFKIIVTSNPEQISVLSREPASALIRGVALSLPLSLAVGAGQGKIVNKPEPVKQKQRSPKSAISGLEDAMKPILATGTRRTAETHRQLKPEDGALRAMIRNSSTVAGAIVNRHK